MKLDYEYKLMNEKKKHLRAYTDLLHQQRLYKWLLTQVAEFGRGQPAEWVVAVCD